MEYRKGEIKSDITRNDKHIFGYAILFGETTRIETENGFYLETVDKKALDSVDLSEVLLFYNHNFDDLPLASTKSKTLKLEIDEKGLKFEANLTTPKGEEVYNAIKKGDLSGVSFGFTVETDIYDVKTNTRTIKKFKDVHECSIVPFPAYKKAVVEARSIKTEKEKYKQRTELKKLANKIYIK